MTGGLIQLAAYGAQDIYLTGNPQITFFKVVYRRHTNFSKECIKQEFNGNVPSTGTGSVTCTLARNGDLVQEIYLKATLSDAKADVNNLIKSVEVEIGGQKIDKHYAAWLDIYNELFETNIDYLEKMTVGTAGTVYIPLRFWFNRNAGLALPLIALQYHEVKILVDVADSVNTVTGGTLAVSDMCLLVNYVYLDTDERRRFAQVSHEYLIEQLQHTGPETITSGAGGKIDMNFNHPVKALLWVGNGTSKMDDIKIQLNGHDRFAQQKADYFHLVQPYECHLGHSHSMNLTTRVWAAGPAEYDVNSSVQMYSFCLKPGEHQPSGSCNFSRIDNARLNYKLGKTDNTHQDELHLFALNYNVLRIMSGMGGLTYSN